ncbi:MAG: IniB N-terminal domain-containing protein [Pseudonocardiaceae bacterium]
MLSVSSLIEFLMNLLRDKDAQAEFVADPEAMLARNGLEGLCGQDVRDVAPMVADQAAVHVKNSGYPPVSDHDDDPVRQIKNITEHYEVKNTVVNPADEYNYTYVDDRDTNVNVNVDDRDTIVNVDDRDTTSIQADGDVTITDSFNQDNDVNVIEDSFNQDNDGVDNKGGTIDDSVVAGNDIEGSLNSDDDTAVVDSFNQDNDETNVESSDDDTTEVDVEHSYNEDNDVVDVDVAESAA